VEPVVAGQRSSSPRTMSLATYGRAELPLAWIPKRISIRIFKAISFITTVNSNTDQG
jgi:hypothetical protein